MARKKNLKTRYIFVTGGVVSSLGKGLAMAALGSLLQARGYSVRLRKLDPYLNVDPGTMSPFQHGEVYVTDDGAETDLDLGHYERFTGIATAQSDNITSGRIYAELIAKERRGDFLGGTVQVIPHVTDAIQEFIQHGEGESDFVLCEIGGTVGDIESYPFIEAIRQFSNTKEPGQCLYIHTTLLPYVAAAGELKTKPTQHSVKELLSSGIQPQIILCRSEREIPAAERRKIALFCNVREENVIPALDVRTIYEVPISYHTQGLDTQVLKFFNLDAGKKPDLTKWKKVVERIRHPKGTVNIAIVGKYTDLLDAYKSLNEALAHGGIANEVKVNLEWMDSSQFEGVFPQETFADIHGILVPGGFGERGAEGKIRAVQFAREQNIPYFGICFGMQMAVIEAARNLAGIKKASSTEFGPTKEAVVGLMTEWMKDDEIQKRTSKGDLGGSMRLGAYDCKLKADSLVADIYGTSKISERHRHRYEVNFNYRKQLEDAGVVFSGTSPDGKLPEIIERKDHPWFVGVQFHPELKSKPVDPHPLFVSFIKAAKKQSGL